MRTNKSFGAIVIGSGMSGGWAAKEFCEKKINTLVLERGRDVKHMKDYPTTNMMPWEFSHRGEVPAAIQEANPIISRCYAYKEDAMHFFVKDTEHPYIQEKPFDWIRGYQVGGKSLMWARHTQRWSDADFEGPQRDGFAVDWPIRYKDLSPWYSHVEKFVGISGNRDGLASLPDGEFLPPLELSCVENYFKDFVAGKYRDRNVIYARCAHLTEPQPVHAEQGRGQCQKRNLCQRGCPFGGYFSSNSSTLPWAQRTGNLTLRTNAVVQSIMYDEKKQRARGVRVIDAITHEVTEYEAPVIFVNASAVNTNSILLNSTSNRFPDGLGNDSGLLGKYFAFHNYRGQISGWCNEFSNFTTEGRTPTCAYMPRFRNWARQEADFLRGYASVIFASRDPLLTTDGVGVKLKQQLSSKEWLPWKVRAQFMGETIPKESNTVSLDHSSTDAWGMPTVKLHVAYDENDEKMLQDFFTEYTAMFKAAGFTGVETKDTKQAPGLDIHEMGGCRMGHDPKTSLLNSRNQMHHCKNVFVTDGACMTSTSTQNPSLTYMALTARAANYAVEELKKGNL